MAPRSSIISWGAYSLVLFGFLLLVSQTNARNVVSTHKPEESYDDIRFDLGFLRKTVHVPSSESSQNKKLSMVDFRIVPKAPHISAPGLNQMTITYPPPLPLLHDRMLSKTKHIPPFGPSHGTSNSYHPINYGMLPKNMHIPPSGPSHGAPNPDHPINYGMLPKNVPIPPSGPNHGAPDHPINYGMLPKNIPIPPSGPSHGAPDHPINYGMLPKNIPIPPSGPSHGSSNP